MDQKQQRLLAEIRPLLLNVRPLFFFELIYYFLGFLVIQPCGIWLFNQCLVLTKVNYLEGSNLRTILSHPIVIVAGIILLVFFAFYILLEYTTIICCLNESRNGHRIRLIPLMRAGISRAARFWHPRNGMMIVFVLILLPFFSTDHASNFIASLSIPGFILTYIQENPLLLAGFIGLCLFVSFYIFQNLYLIQYFTLSQKTFKQSSRASKALLKGDFFKTIIVCLTIDVIIYGGSAAMNGLASLTSYIVSHLGLYDLLQSGQAPGMGVTLLCSAIATLISVLDTILYLVDTPLTLIGLSACYYHYSQKKGLPLASTPLVSDEKQDFWKRFWTKKKQAALILILLGIGFADKFSTIEIIMDPDTAAGIVSQTLIAGHRGDSHDTPENTRAALEKAISLGADYVEIDVCETKDGVIVVNHDNNLKRQTGHDVNIWNSNYADIKDLDTGSWFSPQFSGERLMTLDEAMDVCDGKIKMNIELKPTVHDHDFAEKCVAIFQAHNFYNQGFFASLDEDTLSRVEAIDPKITTCLNTFIALGNLEQLPVDIYSVESTFVNSTLLANVNSQGKSLWVWTVNDETMVDNMIDLGVDAIITDDPGTALTLRNQTAPDSKTLLSNLLTDTFLDFE
ncbi:MAG: glycerophosphodiester phosphodiesterase family protein [Eubacteriaceae bacterium]|nr:glycerophosphodiester phosphodiesterase family protein [Eubacteriaceae bacterium]